MVDLINQSSFVQPRARVSRFVAIAVSSVLLLAACSKPVDKAEETRPVRAIRLAAGNVDIAAEFPGEVRARVESRMGFRVGGKIVARKIDVGSIVKRGQVLMQLDPQDLQLAKMQSDAALKAAESNRDLARAELKRYQELRQRNFVSQAILDSKETAFRAAQASYEQALAAYRNQSNQLGYTNLVADAGGVVTSVEAEVGQVVAAGTPVVRIAQAGEKEIVIGIPEDKVETLRRVTDVRVRTWANPDKSFPGKIRELSPVADPATRTYTAKIAIPNVQEDVKLGMTAYVTFASKAPNAMIKLPLTALFHQKSETSVWIVENGTVKPVAVQVAGTADNHVLVSGGVAPGQVVVTAGVNLLKPGQKVKILDDAARADDSTRSAQREVAPQATGSGEGAGAAK